MNVLLVSQVLNVVNVDVPFCVLCKYELYL